MKFIKTIRQFNAAHAVGLQSRGNRQYELRKKSKGMSKKTRWIGQLG
ncbi:hypothetical protein P4637_10945 [Halalkalibacterium halodurans]|nr:hypothetical protein [Halalkalibacterium halodurans]MDY7220965.1 hypothetical protein [Halalkalibacterium halodurans]MDY7240204.1 hypothetical protein [Halalkalibacterium halodurans]MED4079856.1 hypothetical protein [Halalkalibacterium halodurans]MED4085325.1 hypothetical protein [Halalkalibacterium halodurans]MED4103858.1 hypothetical protein [Halalkalibacterium halodurans]